MTHTMILPQAVASRPLHLLVLQYPDFDDHVTMEVLKEGDGVTFPTSGMPTQGLQSEGRAEVQGASTLNANFHLLFGESNRKVVNLIARTLVFVSSVSMVVALNALNTLASHFLILSVSAQVRDENLSFLVSVLSLKSSHGVGC